LSGFPVPLSDFKAILNLDDRENALSRYCLTMATYTIEQYCKRRLLRKKRSEFLPFYGDYLQGPNAFFCNNNFSWPHAMSHYSENRLTGSPPFWGVLRDYPVREILAVYQTHALKEAIIPGRTLRFRQVYHCTSYSPLLGRTRGKHYHRRY
jgi:hypothetical protein